MGVRTLAYDLVMEPYDIGSADLEDYEIWDKKVVCPVAGTVMAAYGFPSVEIKFSVFDRISSSSSMYTYKLKKPEPIFC